MVIVLLLLLLLVEASPPLSPPSPPPREQFCNRYCSNKHTVEAVRRRGDAIGSHTRSAGGGRNREGEAGRQGGREGEGEGGGLRGEGGDAREPSTSSCRMSSAGLIFRVEGLAISPAGLF